LANDRLIKLLRAVGVALGITTIFLFWLLDPLISTMHDAVYHWEGSWFQLFFVPIVDFCILWLVMAAVLYFARGWLRIAIWCVIIAFTPWVELNNWGYLSHGAIPDWEATLVVILGLAIFPTILLLWRSTFQEKFEHVREFAEIVFVVSAFCGILVLSRYAWVGWKARSLTETQRLHEVVRDPPAEAGRPRVFWIVFDELSYQQVYERRFPGIELPAFDALAAQATVFTHTVPAGGMTEIVLPALMTGEPIDDVRPLPSGSQLKIHNKHTGVWRLFDDHETVFQDAQDLNYRTAVAGWFNPYCRILPDVLDHCFWAFHESAKNTMDPRAPWGSNLMQPWLHFFRFGLGYRIGSIFMNFRGQNDIDAQQHIAEYVTLSDAADRILEDPSLGFALIHMPIPHPNGIYDRRTGEFAIRNSTYLDNVVLADRFLEHLRSKLEQSGQWDSSTIVVMGDHSWRTNFMWRNMPGWAGEEELASQGGQFDDRPAYLVKLPGQQVGAHIDVPFAVVNTRMLFDALLMQKIRSKEDLAAWSMQRGH
jgi:hypothetical protein